MGLYALDENYSVATWYDYQGAFDLNAGTDLLLEQVRHILESDAYVFQGVAWPKGIDTQVGFQQTLSGSVNLIPYSYVFGVNGFSWNFGQYTLRVYDKGGQTDLYYRQMAWYPTVIGTMQNQFAAAGEGVLSLQSQDVPFGPYFFRSPLIVLPPGILQVQVTNSQLDPNYPTPFQNVQLLFLVATPKNTTSMNNRKITHSSDPSGLQSLDAVATLL